ncbi:MAG: hypothetical protein U1E73_01580 [Planctomycetota bacterium]
MSAITSWNCSSAPALNITPFIVDRFLHHLGIGPVGVMDRGSHNDLRVDVDGVLRLVGEVEHGRPSSS